MICCNFNKMDVIRRKLLKNIGKVGISLGVGMSSLESLVGCVSKQSKIFETVEDVQKIKWDSNPAIPVPENGCYVGWYKEIQNKLIRDGWSEAEQSMLDSHNEDFGKMPAVHCISDRKTNHIFPLEFYDKMNENGVFPLLRYHPYCPDFKMILDGKLDRELIILAQGAKEFGKPFFFVPFPEANIPSSHSHIHAWGKSSPKYFEKAWKYMRHIFEEEGANENTVWGLHLLAVKDHLSFNWHDLDDSLFDWMGFTTYNISREVGAYNSFNNMFNNAYHWAKNKHPDKPMALFELGTSDTSRQSNWLKDAYKNIKKKSRIKLALYAEYYFGNPTNFHDRTYFTKRGKATYKEIISDPYFIGSRFK
jgi:hypothetical protein